MVCTGSPIKRTRGDDWTGDNAITGVIKRNGVPVDITGCALAAQLRTDPDDVIALTFTADPGADPAGGEFVLSAERAVTALVATMFYDVSIAITNGGGERFTYWPTDENGARVKFLVEPGVTQ